MENLQNLETTILIAMLEKQTAQLTAKIAERETTAVQAEFELAMIQAELKARLANSDDTDANNRLNYSPAESNNQTHIGNSGPAA